MLHLTPHTSHTPFSTNNDDIGNRKYQLLHTVAEVDGQAPAGQARMTQCQCLEGSF